ncbi:MAG: glycosyltransferase family 2 protein [Clostridium sp.]|nr:glycosyltransferase family 2 protein [Clostridium sp.]
MEIIDIVMSTYNGEHYLKEQIESILKNSWTSWRLWICDDGSKDHTEAVARAYAHTYPDKIFWKPNESNKGSAISFLDGARKVSGEYVMFCDQDDYWLPNKIENTLACMKAAEEKYGKATPLTVFTDARVVDEELKLLKESFHKSNQLDTTKLDLTHMLMENKMMGCTMMLNRALVERLHRFPKKVRMHDWWIGLIAASLGKIVYLDEQTMLYRQHRNNVVGSKGFSLQMILDKVASWKKQKQALLDTQKQAEKLYRLFEEELGEEEKQMVYKFATLHKRNWIERRRVLYQEGFWKSGVIRNIGVFLLI